MTDKVQRIRNEIKRLKNQYMSYADDFHSLGMEDKRDHYAVLASVMEAILNFIDSLQEEPETKFKIGDRIRLKGTTVKGDTIIKIYTSEVGNTYFEFENSGDASADLDWEFVEEHKKCMYTKDDFTEEDRKILCEDCEEECEYAKKEEPVSEELEEASEKCIESFIPEGEFNSATPFALEYVIELLHKTFKAGAEWQKTKLIKDATDVTVRIDSGGYPYIPQMELYDYANDVPLAKEGDKYKVVLIKEE